MPFLQPINRIFYLQNRNSRHSIAQFRKQKSLLKDYRVEKHDDKIENIYEKLNSPLEKIVPINSEKTSITIDILDQETFPSLSEWRKNNLVRRARRVLPLPISLTTDDKLGFTWKQHYLKSLKKSNSRNIENDNNQIPHFIKFLSETNPELFKQKFPALYEKYQHLITNNIDAECNKKDDKNQVMYFPFSQLEKNNQDNNIEPIEESSKLVEFNDEEYENYLKHNEFLQYLSSNLKDSPLNEYKPEIENWASQIWLRNYGNADDSIPPSDVPCSGCGAHLHCVAPNIPGFIPAQKFTLFDKDELRKQICQRCEFLKKYNVSLNVTVSDEEYPKLISKINLKKSLIIIMVDLLDFPCSVWPGIINLIGEKHLIYIVGNKIDLLPKDDQFYLQRIKKSLKESLKAMHINRQTKIRDISLISAKTGYGVDNLVTKLLRDIKSDQDIYLIGCTNAGKSTLFNVLMQSDLCALSNCDLMTRATTSIWPGTTLNLLKFPIKKMKAWEMEMRLNKLNILEKHDIAENKLIKNLSRQSKIRYAHLSERLNTNMSNTSPFIMDKNHPLVKTIQKNSKPFEIGKASKNETLGFLNDTPGVIYKDQLLNLLTTEELLRTIPREIITPRTYTLRPSQTLFLGGLARIDLTQARQHIWITVFGSLYLPVNIVFTEQAKKFYETHVGTEFLSVPLGDYERLKYWPKLSPKEIKLNCIGWEQCSADVVLSSAGWISITGNQDSQCIIKVYTPDGRGIYVRDPPLLPYSIRLRGKRIMGTPCFENKMFTIDDLKPITNKNNDFHNKKRQNLFNNNNNDDNNSNKISLNNNNNKYQSSSSTIDMERIENAAKFIK